MVRAKLFCQMGMRIVSRCISAHTCRDHKCALAYRAVVKDLIQHGKVLHGRHVHSRVLDARQRKVSQHIKVICLAMVLIVWYVITERISLVSVQAARYSLEQLIQVRIHGPKSTHPSKVHAKLSHQLEVSE